MKTKKCHSCGSHMKKNGKTSSGTQRWRCKKCGASEVHKYNTEAKNLECFLRWLLSKETQLEMTGQGRTFRRLSEKYWSIWPMPEVVDEIHRVIYVDGIYIAQDIVILIACSDEYVLSWYLARAETTRAWRALLSRIAPPDMVVSDGGSGFASAVAAEWPNTRVQRCLFHVFMQVRRQTTTRPKLQAGVELYGLAKELMHIETLGQALWWTEKYMQWNEFWADFLEQKTITEGRWEYTHERLRKARRALNVLVNKNLLFTYLDPNLCAFESLPKTNNRIEGGVNAQIRSMLRNHRGMSSIRRIKAVYWWCYMHTECPLSAAEILKKMPKDKDIDLLYETYAEHPKATDAPTWGEAPVWKEFHHETPYPYAID